MVKNKDQFIFQDADEVSCIYFLVGGNAGLVLPHFKNIMYIKFELGCHFGVLDILGSVIENDDIDANDWITYQDSLKRQFSA